MIKKIALVTVLAVALGGGVAFATKDEHEKVTICHHTHSLTNPTVTIQVDEHAVKAHLRLHGDSLGACPVVPPVEPPVTPPVTPPTTPPTTPPATPAASTPDGNTSTPVSSSADTPPTNIGPLK